MIAPSQLTPLPVAVPLAGAALLACLRKWLSRTAADSLGIFVSSANVATCCILLDQVVRNPIVYWFGNWQPRGTVILGIGFVAEPIGVALASLASVLTLLGLIYSWHLTDSGSNHFQSLILIFLAAMCGFSLTADIFDLFVFFELMSTAAFALCGLKTKEPAPLQGSFNFAVTNTIAAFLVLTGIGFLYSMTGALNMAQIGLALRARHDAPVIFAFALLACGFFVKAAIVPFHLWLPDAHAVAPTPVCVLFSGVMVELGLYAVARLRFTIFSRTFESHESVLRAIILALAILTVIIGGLMCYAEHHLKRMLAFSTICHAGIMLLGVGLGGASAFAGMLLYLFAHAFIKGGLFFTSGILLHRLRAIGEQELFAKGKKLYWTGSLWFLGAFGLAAAPPFLLMNGEAAISKAADDLGLSWVSWVCVFGGALTASAVFRVGIHTFLGLGAKPLTDEAAEIGELPETDHQSHRTYWFQIVPAALCITIPIVLAVGSQWQGIIRNAVAAFSSQQSMIRLIYSGIPAHNQLQGWSEALPAAHLRGGLAVILAVLLACTSVFRTNLWRSLRIGAILESKSHPLRRIQSGHPGDYVLWLTIGLSAVSAAAILLLAK